MNTRDLVIGLACVLTALCGCSSASPGGSGSGSGSGTGSGSSRHDGGGGGGTSTGSGSSESSSSAGTDAGIVWKFCVNNPPTQGPVCDSNAVPTGTPCASSLVVGACPSTTTIGQATEALLGCCTGPQPGPQLHVQCSYAPLTLSQVMAQCSGTWTSTFPTN